MTQIYIDFTIRSSITNISLLPFFQDAAKIKEHKIGDRAKSGKMLDYSESSFFGEKITTTKIQTVYDNFFKLIYNQKEHMQEYIYNNNCEVVVYFVIRSDEVNVIDYSMSREMISFFCSLNASISFD